MGYSSNWLRSDERFIEGSKKLQEYYENRLYLKNNNNLELIPIYKVLNRYYVGKNKVKIVLVNLYNDFDIITIKVPRKVSNMVSDNNCYSIETRSVRTWYTLWLGKKQVHEVLGNLEDDKVLLAASEGRNLSKDTIKELQDTWKNIKNTK